MWSNGDWNTVKASAALRQQQGFVAIRRPGRLDESTILHTGDDRPQTHAEAIAFPAGGHADLRTLVCGLSPQFRWPDKAASRRRRGSIILKLCEPKIYLFLNCTPILPTHPSHPLP